MVEPELSEPATLNDVTPVRVHTPIRTANAHAHRRGPTRAWDFRSVATSAALAFVVLDLDTPQT
jgi:hypothetical protein